jgi:hypothetical protein
MIFESMILDHGSRPITVVDWCEFSTVLQVALQLGRDHGSRFRPEAGWLGLDRRFGSTWYQANYWRNK